MKVYKIGIANLSVVIGFFYATQLCAQSTPQKSDVEEISVQEHTLMERFEPDFVVSVEDRIQLKRDRIAKISHTKELLDILDISDRKRRKLLEDLRWSPFSTRLSKVIAETKFESIEN